MSEEQSSPLNIEPNPEHPGSRNSQPPRPEQPAGILDFDSVFESIPLPSRGLLYPPDHPFHMKDMIDIKCMTAEEENILYSPALMKKGTALDMLMKKCIIGDVDPSTLLTADRNAIIVAIRITAYGADYRASVSCPSCNESYENDFSMNGLGIKDIPEGSITPGHNIFETTLPRTGFKVMFRLSTGDDERQILGGSKSAKKLGIRKNDMITRRLFNQVVAIKTLRGETDNRSEIMRFIRKMPAVDSLHLRKAIDEVEPRVELKQEVTCPFCDHVADMPIPLSVEFFWPSK